MVNYCARMGDDDPCLVATEAAAGTPPGLIEHTLLSEGGLRSRRAFSMAECRWYHAPTSRFERVASFCFSRPGGEHPLFKRLSYTPLCASHPLSLRTP